VYRVATDTRPAAGRVPGRLTALPEKGSGVFADPDPKRAGANPNLQKKPGPILTGSKEP
jgi:hypothetical protein